MELHYPRWERQTINTNNSYPKGISGSEKFSPVSVTISQGIAFFLITFDSPADTFFASHVDLLTMLKSVFDHTPKVKLQLFGIKKNEQNPKEVLIITTTTHITSTYGFPPPYSYFTQKP